MAGKTIEPVQREKEREQAWELSLQGVSVNKIAKELNRDRGTVNRYLEEAATLVGGMDKNLLRNRLTAQHEFLYNLAVKNLQDEQMTAKTQTGPQWSKAATQNLLAITKLHGVEEPAKVDIRQHTIIEYVKDFLDGDDKDVWAPNWAAGMPDKYIDLCLDSGIETVEGLHEAGIITAAELKEAQEAMTPGTLDPADYEIIEDELDSPL